MNNLETVMNKIKSDIEIALFLAGHIDNPCIDPITGKNIRPFSIRLAKEQLPRFSNPYAVTFLRDKIEEYSQVL